MNTSMFARTSQRGIAASCQVFLISFMVLILPACTSSISDPTMQSARSISYSIVENESDYRTTRDENFNLDKVIFEDFNIRSKLRENGNYFITVAMPEEYDRTTKNYPVIYLLDPGYGGTRNESIIKAIASIASTKLQFPLVIVGIGYNQFTARNRDYTPSKNRVYPTSGGAAQFLEFIELELIPEVEKNYRVETDRRVLLGHSFGGLFTYFSLFQKPDLFQYRIALSPSLWWDDDMMLNVEREFSRNGGQLSGVLFTAAGSNESTSRIIGPYQKMVNRLKDRGYADLKIIDGIFPDEDHGSVFFNSAIAGIIAIFDITPPSSTEPQEPIQQSAQPDSNS